MPIIDNATLDMTYPHLQPEERVHIVINHDEMSIATNEQRWRLWLAEGQQPLRKEGEWAIHSCLGLHSGDHRTSQSHTDTA